jgi:ribonuclease-3
VLGVPEYQVEESGPDHQKSFRAAVRVGGHVYGTGRGRSKKEAEQQAAEAAWNAISEGEPPPGANHGGDTPGDSGTGGGTGGNSGPSGPTA